MGRVMCIGLDAAEWTLVSSLMQQGRMPNLARLTQSGLSCQLETTKAYRSELPWTIFTSGAGAGSVGYWSTIHFEPSTYDVWETGARRGRPFWAGTGARALLFDVPHVPLLADDAAIQVTAWGAHSPQYPRASQPRGLLANIDREYGPHPAFARDSEPCWFDAGLLSSLGEALVEGSATRAQIMGDLIAAHDWDLALTVMSEPHSAGHHCWHGLDPAHPLAEHRYAAQARAVLEDVYVAIDEAVGALAARCDDDTTLAVFSVHGMQENTNDLTSLVLLPELLLRTELGASLIDVPAPWGWARRGYPPVDVPEGLSWRNAVRRMRASTPTQRLQRYARLRMPQQVMDAKWGLQKRLTGSAPQRPAFDERPIPPETEMTVEQIDAHREPVEWQPPTWYRQWWGQMRAFALPSYSDGHIRINLEGREREGRVPRSEYEATCREIIETVSRAIDPRTGASVVEDAEIVRADDPMDPSGPTADIVIYWKSPTADAIEHPDAGRIGPVPILRTGEHSSNGFAVISGPGIEPRKLERRSATDLPPTILDLMGHSTQGVEGTSLLQPTS